ncbi:hypothetical protein V8C35DRAFT_149898 [Trichoderma chlorosporum]
MYLQYLPSRCLVLSGKVQTERSCRCLAKSGVVFNAGWQNRRVVLSSGASTHVPAERLVAQNLQGARSCRAMRRADHTQTHTHTACQTSKMRCALVAGRGRTLCRLTLCGQESGSPSAFFERAPSKRPQSTPGRAEHRRAPQSTLGGCRAERSPSTLFSRTACSQDHMQFSARAESEIARLTSTEQSSAEHIQSTCSILSGGVVACCSSVSCVLYFNPSNSQTPYRRYL